MSRKEFESREVFKKNELSKIRNKGYEAYRVSPRTTTKYGKSYRKIYGATVEPDYRRPVGKKNKYGNYTKFAPKVSWYPTGYTTGKVKAGTRVIQPLKYYPVDVKEARRKLMVKRKRK